MVSELLTVPRDDMNTPPASAGVARLAVAPPLLSRLDRHQGLKRPPLVRVLVQAHLAERPEPPIA